MVIAADEVEEGLHGALHRRRQRLVQTFLVIVYPLWRIHHNAMDEAGNVRHCDESGEITIDEQEGDDVKLLGIYSSLANAEECIRRARRLPGFREEPECFDIGEYEVDKDTWTEDFVTVTG